MAITGYINLRLLYKVSLPLSLFRKILFGFSVLSFCLLLFLFCDFFLINNYNFVSFVFILILIFVDYYIVDFFEEIYDKIVLWIETKRSRIVREKR